MHTYILKRVPSTPACYRGTLGLLRARFGDLFSPSAIVRWVCNSRDSVLCARVLLLQNVFGKIWTQLSYKLLVQCSNPREIFFYSCLKGLLASELVDWEQKKTNGNQQKNASRPANLLLCLLQPYDNNKNIFFGGGRGGSGRTHTTFIH